MWNNLECIVTGDYLLNITPAALRLTINGTSQLNNSVTSAAEPKAQGTSRKRGQKDCKSKKTRISAARLSFLQLIRKLRP